MPVELRKMKTWSKLAARKRRPSEYEIVTTNLQTRNRHANQAYELSPAPDLAMNEWYEKNVFNSALQHEDWEEFRDPDELIYRVYTRKQDSQEEYVDGLVNEHNEIGHDQDLEPRWLDVLERLYTPRRYLQSALQMNAAYLVQIAPASTLTAAAGFQEGDEFRWMSRIAYRTRELQIAHPDRGFGKKERDYWENDPAWQGIRELMEKVLITYDWGENFVASNLVAKVAVDETLRQLGATARHNGDQLLSHLADNQLLDSDRSRRWSAATVAFSLSHPGNNKVIAGWIDKWMPLARKAIETYCSALPESDGAADNAIANVEAFHRSLGLGD
ncbi:toluene monooxygenase [Sneathiella litorea]|uniref:Toluene monooxygenase n=1 Tax=Sneathiella litorea TaxID=2606216 RepID=A0A6L8W4I8_9PROT|nr:toluene monooxygenase [Sneathiella litorea]MZR29639.1 toluene monooxygenase [Sneathiella litorea]